MHNQKILLKDLPSKLYWLWVYWVGEEAFNEERNLPEAEKVEVFLQWCRTEDAWEDLDEQEKTWLQEHGYCSKKEEIEKRKKEANTEEAKKYAAALDDPLDLYRS